MTRMYIVYTLRQGTDIRKALELLQKTQDDLPEGAFQQLCLRNEKGMAEMLQWMPFGDVVQILDFPHAWQAAEFDDSPAGKAQAQRTKGMFSNIAADSCQITE
ncbi:MAG: hypothetical protein LUF84_00750 [Clostridiales bacterium]|nr:hypothetical protein [Clostridiales bacterium]MCC8099600.1 hypothetical protein [Clostridiales bacterium]MCD7858067.1 hypothetical protein [Clostridiales bacterium]MCD7916988.1 hypothetical protein [Clostridiales bacterium]MCD8086683.1 hypothetical protein [Clostridiales bacterium]